MIPRSPWQGEVLLVSRSPSQGEVLLVSRSPLQGEVLLVSRSPLQGELPQAEGVPRSERPESRPTRGRSPVTLPGPKTSVRETPVLRDRCRKTESPRVDCRPVRRRDVPANRRNRRRMAQLDVVDESDDPPIVACANAPTGGAWLQSRFAVTRVRSAVGERDHQAWTLGRDPLSLRQLPLRGERGTRRPPPEGEVFLPSTSLLSSIPSAPEPASRPFPSRLASATSDPRSLPRCA